MEETFVLGLRLQLDSLCCAAKELWASSLFHSGSIPADGILSLWAPLWGEKSWKKRREMALPVACSD